MADKLEHSAPVAPVVPAATRDGRGQAGPQRKPQESRSLAPTVVSNWRNNVGDAAFIMGVPATELTPKVEEAFAIILGEFDKVRDELAHAKDHVAFLEKQADHHPQLPVLGRRGMLREIARVATRSRQAGMTSSLVVLHLAGIEVVHQRLGQAAAGALAAYGLAIVKAAIRASDAVGTLGDHEVGVVLALADGLAAEDKAGEIARAIEDVRFPWEGTELRLQPTWGMHTFVEGESAAAIVEAADRDRRIRAGFLAAPSAAGPAIDSAAPAREGDAASGAKQRVGRDDLRQ